MADRTEYEQAVKMVERYEREVNRFRELADSKNREATRLLAELRKAEEREFIANSDRGRIKAAFAALRKAGFKAILNETPYESVAESKVGDEAWMDAGNRYVFTYANHWRHAFEEGYGWRATQREDLQTAIYIHYGPDEAAGEQVVHALRVAGLDDQTEWDGEYSSCVIVNPKAKEVAA